MTTIPAEITQDGHGLQIVNVFDRDGKFVRQLRHRGTVTEARATGRLGFMHPSEPGYVDTVAEAQGMDAAAKTRFAAAHAHLYSTEKLTADTADIAALDNMTSAELARETGVAELVGALYGENDDDRRYRAELEKRAHLLTPLLDRAAVTTQPTSNAFWRALSELPASVQIQRDARIRNTVSGQTGTVTGTYEDPGYGYAPALVVRTDDGKDCHYLRHVAPLEIAIAV
ncbi:hypothetical protein [Streptosporangium sp. G12]